MKENTSVSEEIKDVKKGEISEYEVIYNGYISNFESKIIKNVDEYNSLKEDSTLDNIAKEKLDSNHQVILLRKRKSISIHLYYNI